MWGKREHFAVEVADGRSATARAQFLQVRRIDSPSESAEVSPNSRSDSKKHGATTMANLSLSNRPARIVRVTVLIVGILTIGALLGIGGVKAAHELHGPPPPPVAQYSAGYGLDGPVAASMVGSDLFVANESGNSVTEVNAWSGAHVATIAGRSFGLDQPRAIISDGPALFVANGASNTVTEIDPTNRSLIRTISGFSDPLALAAESARAANFWSRPGSRTAVLRT